MANTLLDSNFLFRFAIPCRHVERAGTAAMEPLGDACLLPHFAALEGQRRFAEVRVGWSEQGLAVALRVVGKKQTLWCRDTRIEDSDGIQLWIDTRDTHNVHRAGRFCHRLGLLPAGSGRQFDAPVAALLAINRARESPRPINDRLIQVRARRLEDGYSLDAAIPANALTGFDPAEHPRLGFFYTVIDRELGFQSLSLSREFPVAEDPSLWATLELSGR